MVYLSIFLFYNLHEYNIQGKGGNKIMKRVREYIEKRKKYNIKKVYRFCWTKAGTEEKADRESIRKGEKCKGKITQKERIHPAKGV